MNEQQTLLADMAERLFKDVTASRPDEIDPGPAVFAARWAHVEDSGLSLLLVPEALHGFGGGGEEAWLAFQLAGRHAIDLPVPETILAAYLLAAAGLEIPPGPLTIAPRAAGSLDQVNGTWRFTGDFEAVPWGRYAHHVVGIFVQDGRRFVISAEPAAACSQIHHASAADEPRDGLHFSGAAVACAACPDWIADMRYIGALMRAAQIAGACRGALDLSLKQANDRSQFGKPIGKFQAIQHQLATLAEQTAGAEAGSRAALMALGHGGLLETASAKIIANIAAEAAVTISHQVHGAMGFTWEYSLHHLTRRLIAWRSEFGNLHHWSRALGAAAAARGPDQFWPMVVDGSPEIGAEPAF
jgi:acyl-CoA dehydrogenase